MLFPLQWLVDYQITSFLAQALRTYCWSMEIGHPCRHPDETEPINIFLIQITCQLLCHTCLLISWTILQTFGSLQILCFKPNDPSTETSFTVSLLSPSLVSNTTQWLYMYSLYKALYFWKFILRPEMQAACRIPRWYCIYHIQLIALSMDLNLYMCLVHTPSCS
jgi:hypothetical protein